VWSVPSFTELRREGLAAERWSLLHPEGRASLASSRRAWPIAKVRLVAATDYVRLYADQIPPLSLGATSSWARTVLVAATGAANCATSSRSTAVSSRLRR